MKTDFPRRFFKTELRNCPGSTRAPRVVFRALAENRERTPPVRVIFRCPRAAGPHASCVQPYPRVGGFPNFRVQVKPELRSWDGKLKKGLDRQRVGKATPGKFRTRSLQTRRARSDAPYRAGRAAGLFECMARVGVQVKHHRLILALAALLWLALVPPHSRAAEPASGETVECANLIYAGTKSSFCFSEQFLATVGSETSINTSRKFKPVKLAEKEIFQFPFAVITGEGAFTLTEDERKNLKAYLEKGGFLLASAGCSSKEWGDSFAHEVESLFPGQKLAEVGMDHPIFRTLFEVKQLDMSHGGVAKLYGLTLNGKIVLIYSPDGLNDTGTMHGCCCCGGNEIQNSQKVNANILAYALLQ